MLGTMMYRTASSDNMKASFLSAELPRSRHDDDHMAPSDDLRKSLSAANFLMLGTGMYRTASSDT
jgi:hypothetical protein